MKTAIAFLILGGLQLAAQDMQSCPMHTEHMKEASQHQADVEKHGDDAMGFPHDKTTHHFRLNSDGGAIEVPANDTKDSQNMQAIRSHLTYIVTMFSNGEFPIPMFVHDQVPPGVPVMKEQRAEIAYPFEELPSGGRVRIKDNEPESAEGGSRLSSFSNRGPPYGGHSGGTGWPIGNPRLQGLREQQAPLSKVNSARHQADRGTEQDKPRRIHAKPKQSD
jgi:hypothetical protein